MKSLSFCNNKKKFSYICKLFKYTQNYKEFVRY